MSGQVTVTVTSLHRGKKNSHKQSLRGLEKATGGCQLREKEGHHLLREGATRLSATPQVPLSQAKHQQEERTGLKRFVVVCGQIFMSGAMFSI